MDPEANLLEQLRLSARILAISDAADPETGENTTQEVERAAEAAFRLAELVEALDRWVSRGGFLPKRWNRR